MENLEIILITCGIGAMILGFIFMTDESFKPLSTPGVILFYLGLLSVYVGLAIHSLWMLIIVPIIVIWSYASKNNHS